jgi:hypothetical protein
MIDIDPTALEAYASLQFPPDELHRPDGNVLKKKKKKVYSVLYLYTVPTVLHLYCTIPKGTVRQAGRTISTQICTSGGRSEILRRLTLPERVWPGC